MNIADLEKRLADLDRERSRVLAALEQLKGRVTYEVPQTVAQITGGVAGRAALSNAR
jgi:hypothetical protein